jgi:hypothetical protein
MREVSPELLAAIAAAQQREPNENRLYQSARVGWGGKEDRAREWLPQYRARDVIGTCCIGRRRARLPIWLAG